jgi:CHAT domain-containing protein
LADADSLARAFLLAGVPEVVASRWDADSSATAALMDSFYRILLDGRSAPQALQAAAAELRRLPATSHPYYWAAFSAFGPGNSKPTSTQKGNPPHETP